MSDTVELATDDIDLIENLHESSDHVFVTCPEREGACLYRHGPDRPDDYDLVSLLDNPFCSSCGCSLVIVSRADYDGPADQFRDLDEEGSPVVA